VPHRFPALIADPPRGEGRLWLTGGRLFDGTGGPAALRNRPRPVVLAHDRPMGTRASPVTARK